MHVARFVAAVGVSLVTTTAAHAAIIIVPDDQPTIQAAVDAALPGDTIQVRPGTYPERVRIPEEKPNLALEGLGGRPVVTPPCNEGIRADGRGIRVTTSPSLTFDLNEADGNTRSGIYLDRCELVTVTDNNADGNSEYGIQVKKSPPIATAADLMATGNTASGNTSGDFLVVP
jgi:parallel beta-helix repeat protein